MSLSSLSRRSLFGLIGMAAFALAGCGRKAEPKPPPDADPKSPRLYPMDRRRPPEEPEEPAPQQESPFLTPPADPFNRSLPPSPVYR